MSERLDHRPLRWSLTGALDTYLNHLNLIGTCTTPRQAVPHTCCTSSKVTDIMLFNIQTEPAEKHVTCYNVLTLGVH